jgi:hypothetical protein
MKKMVIAHPESNHFGRLLFKPILEKKVLIISTGQTMHHTRPKNIAPITMAGHQYDHTNRFPKLVLRNCFKNAASLDEAAKPVTINIIYATNEMYFRDTRKYDRLNARFTCFNIGLILGIEIKF